MLITMLQPQFSPETQTVPKTPAHRFIAKQFVFKVHYISHWNILALLGKEGKKFLIVHYDNLKSLTVIQLGHENTILLFPKINWYVLGSCWTKQNKPMTWYPEMAKILNCHELKMQPNPEKK